MPKELLNTSQTYHFLLCKDRTLYRFCVCTQPWRVYLFEYKYIHYVLVLLEKTSICVPKKSRDFSMFSKTDNTEAKVISFFFYTLFNKAETLFSETENSSLQSIEIILKTTANNQSIVSHLKFLVVCWTGIQNSLIVSRVQ